MHLCTYLPHDQFLPATKVAERYGCSKMTLWRRLKSNLGFPQPFYIGRNRYWKERDLVEWERSLPRGANTESRRAA
jgi:predicted DNA-binding transcriptional regulator AlpA